MRGILSDVRYAIRLLLKNPGFSLVAAGSLALGIGANTAIFTLLDAVLLRDLPVRNARELVLFGKGRASGIGDDLPDGPTQLFSHPFYRELREKNQVFSDVLALQSFGTRAYVRISGGNGSPVPVETQLVSGNYFSALGVNPGQDRGIIPLRSLMQPVQDAHHRGFIQRIGHSFSSVIFAPLLHWGCVTQT